MEKPPLHGLDLRLLHHLFRAGWGPATPGPQSSGDDLEALLSAIAKDPRGQGSDGQVAGGPMARQVTPSADLIGLWVNISQP